MFRKNVRRSDRGIFFFVVFHSRAHAKAKEKRVGYAVRMGLSFFVLCSSSSRRNRINRTDGRFLSATAGRVQGKPDRMRRDGVGYLESVVGPATEFQHARLLVEREKFHVDLARRFEYGRRFPFYQPYVIYGRLGGQRHVEISVGAADHTHTHTHDILQPVASSFDNRRNV